MTKNWHNDCRVGWKSPSNLLEHIGIDGDLEEELKQFEGVLEREMKLWICKLLKIYSKSIILSKKR